MLAVLALTGCAQRTTTLEPGPAQPDPSGSVLSRLGESVAAVDRTRQELLAGPAAVITAATALDDADEASATGARGAARAARDRARAAVPAAATALAALPGQAAAYRAALEALSAAAAPLEPAQKAALGDVVAAGQGEANAVEAFGVAAGTAWPSYTALDKAQSSWLERATAGWYRTESEAADAYAVFLRPRRAALDTARASLGAADAARRAATDRQRDALTAADAALDPLR